MMGCWVGIRNSNCLGNRFGQDTEEHTHPLSRFDRTHSPIGLHMHRRQTRGRDSHPRSGFHPHRDCPHRSQTVGNGNSQCSIAGSENLHLAPHHSRCLDRHSFQDFESECLRRRPSVPDSDHRPEHPSRNSHCPLRESSSSLPLDLRPTDHRNHHLFHYSSRGRPHRPSRRPCGSVGCRIHLDRAGWSRLRRRFRSLRYPDVERHCFRWWKGTIGCP